MHIFFSAIIFPPEASHFGGKIIIVSGCLVKKINIGILFVLLHVNKRFSKKIFFTDVCKVVTLRFLYFKKHPVRKWSSFIDLQGVDQFSQHHLLKRLSLLHCIFLPPLSKIRCPYVCGFISELSVLFHWSICLSLCQYHTVIILLTSLVVKLSSWVVWLGLLEHIWMLTIYVLTDQNKQPNWIT